MPSLALYQPEIAGNVGAVIRLCACFEMDLHIIEPCGFPWVERKIKQSAMDYFNLIKITRHNDWDAFKNATHEQRLLLMTTKASEPYTSIDYKPNDILLAGSESAGVPQTVHDHADKRIMIPIGGQSRSLNLAMSCAVVGGEVKRQLG